MAMPTDDALFILASWFSPSYPVGGFAYSHGLEWEIAHGTVKRGADLTAWISDCITHGAGRNDAILLAAAFKDPGNPAIANMAEALQPSKERHLETMAMGRAFVEATNAAWPCEKCLKPAAYPVVVGRAASFHGLPLLETVQFYLHAMASNLVSVGIRLIPIGQAEGQACLADLMPVVQRVADDGCTSNLDDIGGATLLADISSMKHEIQPVRLFRS